jgi:hypothetical protein
MPAYAGGIVDRVAHVFVNASFTVVGAELGRSRA